MLVCGVDEAGRGSVIGPLVVAGVTIERKKLRRLSRTGVQDSKMLTPSRREELYSEITEIAHSWVASKIQPSVIDSHVRKHKLNIIEAKHMAQVISKMLPKTAYVDACDVNAKRFGNQVTSMLVEPCSAIIKSHHKADSRFVIVSAASIIAKVTRDRAIAKIQKQHNIGSGYPADPTCIMFLKKHAKKTKLPPKFARKTWKTISEIYGLPRVAAQQRVRGRGRKVQVPLIPKSQTRLKVC